MTRCIDHPGGNNRWSWLSILLPVRRPQKDAAQSPHIILSVLWCCRGYQTLSKIPPNILEVNSKHQWKSLQRSQLKCSHATAEPCTIFTWRSSKSLPISSFFCRLLHFHDSSVHSKKTINLLSLQSQSNSWWRERWRHTRRLMVPRGRGGVGWSGPSTSGYCCCQSWLKSRCQCRNWFKDFSRFKNNKTRRRRMEPMSSNTFSKFGKNSQCRH